MDLHEDKEKNLVTATFELPSLKKEDVNIEVHDGRLTVSAESKISEEHEERGYAVRERRYGKFSRTLQLPQGVKVSLIWHLPLHANSIANVAPIGERYQGVPGERCPHSHLPKDNA
jgi:hypothetical protein